MAPRICVNILMLPASFGGIGNVTYHLLRRLAADHPGWEIDLLVNSRVADGFRDLPGIRIRSVGIRSRTGLMAYLHLVFPFLAWRYSLLHSNANYGLVFCPVPQIITVHDAYERVSPERFGLGKRFLMSFLVSWSGRRARRIIAVSRSTRKDLERFYPHLAGKIEVIYSGRKFPLRQDAGPDGRAGFLFVGTLEPGKNLPLVLKAFALFLRERPGRLKVAGAKGWKQSGIPDLLRELGIADEVEFMGFIPDEALREEYRNALALIQASTYEGFGLPVIEAMACGCPVIAARNSGLIESGGDAALFFETGDAAGLARRMLEAHDSSRVRAECIRKGLLHAASFSWEKTAEAVAGQYRMVLGRDA